jgi:hypothetical protein
LRLLTGLPLSKITPPGEIHPFAALYFYNGVIRAFAKP